MQQGAPSPQPPHANPNLGQVLRDTPRPLWMLLLLATLMPALLVGSFAWQRHDKVIAEVEQVAQRSVLALEQHIGSVLQTHTLLLHQIAERTEGQTWQQIREDRELQETLSEISAGSAKVSLLGMADAQGQVQISSDPRQLDLPGGVAERDYFLAHSKGEAQGVFFSAPFVGRLSGMRQFVVSIARRSADGAFDGIVFAAVSLDYLARFWDQFVPSGGYLIPLMREDGTMLMRYPTVDIPRRLDPNGPFVTQTRRSPNGLYTAVSLVDGIKRINAYRRVGDFPLFISFSVEADTALEQWRREMLPALLLALLATAALVTLSLIVIRSSYRQRQAVSGWRRVAFDLEGEIQRRQAAEEKLHQAQKMEAFGQLTGGLAHDVNNMLAGISGNLELIRVRLAMGDTGAAAACVDRAEAASDKAARLIQRLLSFARRKALRPEAVNVNALLQAATDLFRDAVGARISIETELPETSPVARCDPAQLESALLNLVINARDAMPDGGRITISVTTEQGQQNTGGARVLIRVRDTGVGMQPEVIARAFEPFYTTKGIGEGSGLGLSMVYGFAQQSGGTVSISSEINVGTEICLSLPAIENVGTPTPTPAPPPVAEHPALPATLLLVEDDRAVRQVLAEVLQQAGSKVLLAGRAEEALELLTRSPKPDLVVTDIGLPGSLNGYQLAAEIRRHYPDIPFLFISGFSGAVRSSEPVVQPQDRLLSKPFKTAAFLETLNEMQRERQNGTR